MVGLLDIAPAAETVSVAGKALEVRGLSARSIVHLLGRFPQFRALLSGRQIDTQDLFALVGDAMGPVLAAGLGHLGETEWEKELEQLGPDDALALLEPILRLTMPNGIGPFVERLSAMGGLLSVESPAKAPATKSRGPSKA